MIMSPRQLTGKVSTHLVETAIGEKNFWVHWEVQHDLLALKQAADSAGFNLNIASGFRDFERQMTIWNRKMSGEATILDNHSHPLNPSSLSQQQKIFAILRWSALPGASRHHWGSDFDLFDRNALTPGVTLQLKPWEYFEAHQRPFYLWLTENLAQFGFFFPYKEDRGGVAIEPWHISHQATAQACQKQLSLDILHQELQSSSIIGEQLILDNLETIYNQYITNLST